MSEVLDETDGWVARVEPATPAARPGTARIAAGGRWVRSHAVALAGIPAAATALFLLYLHQARTAGLNADGSSNALQAWDMLHGNLLLSHWTLSDVSFWLTELPEYMLVEAVHGLNGDVVHLAAALTYTLAVLLAAWLAKGRATGADAFVRVLVVLVVMIAPGLRVGTVVELSSPDHFGTAVPMLVIFLAVERLPQRRYTPPILFLLLVWAGISDSTATLVAGGGLAVLCALRLWNGEGRRRYEAALLGAAVLSIAVASALPKVINRLGGFLLHPPNVAFNATDQMSDAVWHATGSFLTLFAADFFGMPVVGSTEASAHHGVSETAVTLLHLSGAALVLWALAVTLRRLPRSGDLIARLLAVGVLLNLAAFVLSTEITGSTREIAAVLPLGAALAGRVIGPRLKADRRLVAVLAALAVVFSAVLVRHAVEKGVQANSHEAEVWLKEHGYTYGLGGYWSANNITVDSAGTVQVRPVDSGPRGIQQYDWESKSTWYDPGRYYADFLVVDTASAGAALYANPEQAVKQFGAPARIVKLRNQEIMVWNKNLLESLPLPSGG
jgi:hypothetical protein